MEPVCEFCGVMRAVVYCKSDMACLCLQCDDFVHSANVLSQRHLRSLLCDKCNSQPATMRCLEDKFSFCESCDRNGNGCLETRHVWQTLSFYSGCPSTEEFMKIWFSVLDHAIPADLKDINVCDVDIMHEGFDIEDSGLNSDSSSEVQTGSKGQPGYSFMDVRLDCSLVEKSFSVTESDNGPKQNAAEASSSGQHDGRSFCSSQSAGSVQVLQAANNGCNQASTINPFHAGQVYSSLPLPVSKINCENSVTDLSDCGLSSEASDSPWDSKLESSCLEARNRAKMRYNEKKKTRKFGKQIRYAPPKARGETRIHVRGFVTAAETCDNN